MPGTWACATVATAGLLASAFVMAGDLAGWPAGSLLAGEIIMVPPPGSSKASSKAARAAEQRDRAKAYQQDEAAVTPTIIVVPEEESEGALSPRRGAPAEGRARDNRSRAADYQRGTDSSSHPGLIKQDTGIILDSGSTQERAHDNRARASGYSRGDGSGSVTGRVGPDGIPLVVCKDRDNVAGQIGDGLQSGSVIVILRDGKQVKVRCQ